MSAGAGAGPSALHDLACARCGTYLDADSVQHLCACGSPLLARYDLERAGVTLDRQAVVQRRDGLWRWRELLPVRDERYAVSLGEVTTPLLALPSTGSAAGIADLRIKDEGVLPTGSFKARGAAVALSRAHELGVRAFALPTNGNAGAAWAAYGRRAGMEALIAMPASAPLVHRAECEAFGASLTLVDGLISDAGKVASQWVRERGAYDAATLKEPYRIEGKKTLGFEIAEQYEWNGPDVIAYPTGGGVGLIGIDKAYEELRALGMTAAKPRLVAVQAAGCAPIVDAWKAHARESTFWSGAHTIAFGINVPKALGDFLVLDALYRSAGCAAGVDDDAIVAARERVARTDGTLLCLEGAATIAAVEMLRANGWISARDRVLAINTASAFKSPLPSTATG